MRNPLSGNPLINNPLFIKECFALLSYLHDQKAPGYPLPEMFFSPRCATADWLICFKKEFSLDNFITWTEKGTFPFHRRDGIYKSIRHCSPFELQRKFWYHLGLNLVFLVNFYQPFSVIFRRKVKNFFRSNGFSIKATTNSYSPRSATERHYATKTGVSDSKRRKISSDGLRTVRFWVCWRRRVAVSKLGNMQWDTNA